MKPGQHIWWIGYRGEWDVCYSQMPATVVRRVRSKDGPMLRLRFDNGEERTVFASCCFATVEAAQCGWAEWHNRNRMGC